MKFSYTLACPECHTMMSYAPSKGEVVRCAHLRKKNLSDEFSEPCSAVVEKVEAK
jgi:hypothetical protein